MKFIWFLIYSYLFYRLVKSIVRLAIKIRADRNRFKNQGRNVEEADYEVLDDDEES